MATVSASRLTSLADRAVKDVIAAGALTALAVVAARVPSPYFGPITFISADEVEVHPWAMGVEAPATEIGRMRVQYGMDSGDAAAAVRANLAENLGWGPRTRVRVLLPDGRSVALVGPLSAIRQAYPDTQTLKDWQRAGVRLYPVADTYFETSDGRRLLRARFVPVEQAPIALQIEHEARGLAAEAIAREG